jgi:hypothetical protein
VTAAQPGDTVWVKAGDYEDMVRITNAGTQAAPITLSAWQDDRVRIGYQPRSLPTAGAWEAVAGTKCFRVRLTEDVPEDFLLIANGKGIVTLMQDGPPKDEQLNWAAYRKSDRTLMWNTDGKDPATLGPLQYGRRPASYSFCKIETPAAWWVIRHFEFSWQGTGMYLCGNDCTVEDCFFTHCYRAGLFLHGRTSIVRRCSFYLCGSGIGASGAGPGHIVEDNLIVDCSHLAEEDILVVDIPGAAVESAGPTVFKGNMLCQTFMHNTLSDNKGAGWYADCPGSQSARVIGNAFWDNPGGGMYNEGLVNDTVCQGNCFYRNYMWSSVCTRLNIIENLFYGCRVGWHNLEFYPLRDGYMLLRNNAFVNPGPCYLEDFATAWGQTPYPDIFRRCMVDYNRIWTSPDGVLINDGGTGTKYGTLDEVRREFGWELHGEVKPYNGETVEQAAQAMGGSVVTYRIPWGAHTAEARPMLSNADIEGRWPAAPLTVDATCAPSYFWRVADGNYDASRLWPDWDPNFAYHEFWQPRSQSGELNSQNRGCRWYVDSEAKFPPDVLEKMPSRKDVLNLWAWRPAYSIGNHWLVMEGVTPDQMLPEGVGYWSPWLATVPGAQITVSMRLRGKDLAPTQDGSPAIWLEFTNETGQQRQRIHLLDQQHHPELSQGTYDWTSFSETATAPEGAIRMALFFGLLPCKGEIDFDDINLKTADG